jgi:hypothetical protein
MTNLRTQLQIYLRHPLARTAARTAPAALLAGLSGAVLGSVLHDPAIVETGVGFILSGVAVNHLTDLVTQLMHLPLEEEDKRVEIIEQGLEAGDAGINQATAAALVHAGPDLALALPPEQRTLFVDALAQGMRGAGGALAAIAAAYTTGLHDPTTHWAALQAELRTTVQTVSQTMRADGQGSTLEDNKQRVEGATGRVEQVMEATNGGTLKGNEQVIITGRRP